MRSLGRTSVLAAGLTAALSIAAYAASHRRGPSLPRRASQELCESIPGRLFVATTVGSECIAYWVTKGNENRRQAVFFIDGDLPPVADAAAFEEHMQKTESGIRKLMQKWADKLHVRYVYLARPGLHGSSGDHKERMKPHETLILGAAAKLLKDKLGLDSIALAGQSRGSTIAASLLTLKLHDVKCAVLGSGAFEIVDLKYDNHAKAHHPIEKAKLRKIMYDPSAHVDGIEPDPARRIFVLGDREDPKAAFPQQTHFVESLKAAGNHRSRSRSRPTITMAPHVSRSRRRPPASTVWQTRRSSPPSPRCSRSTSSACPTAWRTTPRAVRRRRHRWCSTRGSQHGRVSASSRVRQKSAADACVNSVSHAGDGGRSGSPALPRQ